MLSKEFLRVPRRSFTQYFTVRDTENSNDNLSLHSPEEVNSVNSGTATDSNNSFSFYQISEIKTQKM